MKTFFVSLVCVILALPVWAADDDFSRIDKDGNGRIEKQDYLEAVSRQFDKLDRNKDGSIDKKELKKGAPHLSNRFSELDVNKDGKISRDEFVQGALRDFELLDANKDGAIDRSEFEAYRKKQTTQDPDVKKHPFILFRF
jgi:Ca2+-binding EF-hand superfamily protein